MPCGKRQHALRSFVAVARRLAAKYMVRGITAQACSEDQRLKKAYKTLCLSVHPDRGGSTEDFQDLQHAYEVWTECSKARGRPPASAGSGPPEPSASPGIPQDLAPALLLRPRDEEQASGSLDLAMRQPSGTPAPPTFRIRTEAVLLTFSLGQVDDAVWPRFLAHVHKHKRCWCVKHWCATLETSADRAMHVHLMLQFHRAGDVASSHFAFEAVKPNARPSYTDLLGERFAKRSPQTSFDRGFFYVWVNKKGTVCLADGSVCVAGDYAPAWTETKKKYKVLRKWPQSLWEAHKLTHEVWDELIFLTRQGVVGAKRNLEAVQEHELERAEQQELMAVVKRIRGNPDLYRPFVKVPEAETWLQCFQKDAVRFPILLVLGQSFVGKTEWSKSLFARPLELKIGPLTHFPEKMRTFSRQLHDGVVLDDVRDLEFLAQHQHILQGKYDERVEFASTPGGQCAYRRWLYRVPFVATVNYSTANLEYLRSHDWLKKPENCVLVELQAPPVVPAPGPSVLLSQPSVLPPAEAMRRWSVADVKTFLCSRELRGLADACFTNGVNGEDLSTFDESALKTELCFTPFQAKKLLAARAAFLIGQVGDGRSGR